MMRLCRATCAARRDPCPEATSCPDVLGRALRLDLRDETFPRQLVRRTLSERGPGKTIPVTRFCVRPPPENLTLLLPFPFVCLPASFFPKRAPPPYKIAYLVPPFPVL
ncbi:hypothetical protein TNCT_654191 [Trichonephila clavata]|uniref:Uncharacterized protein n=1 Tax=Trichonephila clavata TaxID=2740835 RepID=A0A8X6F927_TRICU|nr:hypothetical protein TNCT_654191 [Trichonephila clavata]